MNSYERIYNLLTEAKITIKTKAKPTRTTPLSTTKSGQTKLKKTLKSDTWKRGQKIFGKPKDFNPGAPQFRPTAASEREKFARQGMVPPRVGGRTRRGMR